MGLIFLRVCVCARARTIFNEENKLATYLSQVVYLPGCIITKIIIDIGNGKTSWCLVSAPASSICSTNLPHRVMTVHKH